MVQGILGQGFGFRDIMVKGNLGQSFGFWMVQGLQGL